MFKISQEKIDKRWDILPDNLRNTISDQLNSDFIWKECEEQYIPEEKIYSFLKISAYVLMGFIHPEDMSKELQEITGIDKRIVDDICNKINNRIFSIVKDSIDKVYTFSNTSLPQQEIPSPTNNNGPVILSDIKNDNSQNIPPTPTISIQNTTTIKKDFDSKENSKNELIQKDNYTQNKNIPMPVILQNDSSFVTVKQNSNFHVEISEDKMKEFSKNPQTTTIKPAKIEFGTINKNSQSSSVINLNNKNTIPVFNENLVNLNSKNRIITEIIPDAKTPKDIQFNEIKIEAPVMPSPIKNNINDVLDKPIPPIPQKQIPQQTEKPIISPEKIQSFFKPIIKNQNVPIKKDIVIQKDYSETDLINKPKNNTIPPAPKAPIPTPNKSATIKEPLKDAFVPPFIIK